VCIGNLGTTGAVTVSGGTFVCTNSGGTSVVDVIRGVLTVTNSTVLFDNVFATNNGGRIALNGGSISAKQFTVQNGLPFTVGAGTNVTTLRLTGGVNVFSNGLVVASNATVVGNGAIYGNVVNNGTFIADQANTSFIFYGSVTNNRTMIQTNGGALDFRGPLVNNGVIVTNPSSPVVSFTAGPTNGLAPLTVLFTNLSSGATNYAWDFGDGKISAIANPTNTYTNAATYTVKLTALGAGGSNSLTRINYIVVTDNLPPPSRITDLRRIGTTNQISFTTIAGVTYAVEATITLTNSSWFTITNNFPGNNATNSINDDAATNDSRFYRIKGQ
jgi:PKD repeat protein